MSGWRRCQERIYLLNRGLVLCPVNYNVIWARHEGLVVLTILHDLTIKKTTLKINLVKRLMRPQCSEWQYWEPQKCDSRTSSSLHVASIKCVLWREDHIYEVNECLCHLNMELTTKKPFTSLKEISVLIQASNNVEKKNQCSPQTSQSIDTSKCCSDLIENFMWFDCCGKG